VKSRAAPTGCVNWRASVRHYEPVTDDVPPPDLEALTPSRQGRRARRRTVSAAAPAAPEPMATVLAAVMALQTSNEELVAEVRELRRRITALSSKVELLGERLVEGESTERLRVAAPKGRTRSRPS
jgi:hypothetical protein